MAYPNLVPEHGPTKVCIVRTDCRRRFLGHQLPLLPATRPDITNKRLLVLQSFYYLLSACQEGFLKNFLMMKNAANPKHNITTDEGSGTGLIGVLS